MKRINQEDLVWSVETIWTKVHLNRIITNALGCLEQLLSVINNGCGGNNLVKTKRGVKYERMKFYFNLKVVRTIGTEFRHYKILFSMFVVGLYTFF